MESNNINKNYDKTMDRFWIIRVLIFYTQAYYIWSEGYMKSLFIEINHECNLNCKHCYNLSNQKSEAMTYDCFSKMIYELKEERSFNISISGGEPLLHPDITKFIDIVIERKYNVILVTNGLLLDKIKEKYLLCSNPIAVQISLDGVGNADAIRGKGHFESVERQLRDLYISGYKKGILRMTVNNINKNDIEDFFSIAIEYGFLPTFSLIQRSGNAKEYWNELFMSSGTKIQVMEKIKKLYIQNQKVIKTLYKGDITDLFINESYHCPILDSQSDMNILIKANGDVQPCHSLYESVFSIGNIKEDSIYDVTSDKKNSRITVLRDFFNSRNKVFKSSICRECIANEKCDSGCPAVAITDSGSILGRDDYCSVRRGRIYLNLFRGKLG